MKTKHYLFFADSSEMTLENQTIDLVITSCAYPMIAMWDDHYKALNPRIERALERRDGYEAFRYMHLELGKIWHEVDRVLKFNGIVCINIGDATRTIGDHFRLYSNHASIIKWFEDHGYDILPEILWVKTSNKPNKFMGSGMLPTGAYITQEHEYILLFRKGAPRKFPPKDPTRYESAFFWEERNQWFSDQWTFHGVDQALDKIKAFPQTKPIPSLKLSRERSAAFPFELPYRLINMFSVYGDVVLDPFLGTGTTTIAAMATGRSSVGYEIDETLHRVINHRIGQVSRYANMQIEDRIKRHQAFIEEAENLKYTSRYGPVKTKQEENICFYKVESIIKEFESRYTVQYKEAVL
jgi:DNA modification methylase